MPVNESSPNARQTPGGSESSTPARILVVDDDEQIRETLAECLRFEGGYSVDTAANGRDALDLLAVSPYDLVTTDLVMPQMDGVQLLRALRQDYPGVPAIVISGTTTGTLAAAASALRVHRIFRKPVNLDALYESIAYALKIRAEAARSPK